MYLLSKIGTNETFGSNPDVFNEWIIDLKILSKDSKVFLFGLSYSLNPFQIRKCSLYKFLNIIRFIIFYN
jgi:hypothetical protein